MDASRAGRLRPAGQPELLQRAAHDARDLAQLRPGDARNRIEIDAQLVGVIQVARRAPGAGAARGRRGWPSTPALRRSAARSPRRSGRTGTATPPPRSTPGATPAPASGRRTPRLCRWDSAPARSGARPRREARRRRRRGSSGRDRAWCSRPAEREPCPGLVIGTSGPVDGQHFSLAGVGHGDSVRGPGSYHAAIAVGPFAGSTPRHPVHKCHLAEASPKTSSSGTVRPPTPCQPVTPSTSLIFPGPFRNPALPRKMEPIPCETCARARRGRPAHLGGDRAPIRPTGRNSAVPAAPASPTTPRCPSTGPPPTTSPGSPTCPAAAGRRPSCRGPRVRHDRDQPGRVQGAVDRHLRQRLRRRARRSRACRTTRSSSASSAATSS